MSIEPGWVATGLVVVINGLGVAYASGRLTQKVNYVDDKAGKAHIRIDNLREPLENLREEMAITKNDVSWIKKKLNGGE